MRKDFVKYFSAYMVSCMTAEIFKAQTLKEYHDKTLNITDIMIKCMEKIENEMLEQLKQTSIEPKRKSPI